MEFFSEKLKLVCLKNFPCRVPIPPLLVRKMTVLRVLAKQAQVAIDSATAHSDGGLLLKISLCISEHTLILVMLLPLSMAHVLATPI